MPHKNIKVTYQTDLPKLLEHKIILMCQLPKPSPHNRATYSISSMGTKIDLENQFNFSKSEKQTLTSHFLIYNPDKLPDDKNSFHIKSRADKIDFPSTFQNLPSEIGPEYTLKTFPNFFAFYQPELFNFPSSFHLNKGETLNFPSIFDEKIGKDVFCEKHDIGDIFEFHDPVPFVFEDDFSQIRESHCEKKDFESTFKFRASKIWRWLETFLITKPEISKRHDISFFLISTPSKLDVPETFVHPEPLIHDVPTEYQLNMVQLGED